MKKTKKIYLTIRFLLLRFWAFFFLKKKTSQSLPEEIHKILIMGAPRIGDVAMSLHVFANLKSHFPDASITVLSKTYPSEIYALDPNVDSVLLDSGGMLSVLKKIKAQAFDLLIDLTCEYKLRYAFMAGLSNAKYTVGYNYSGRGVLFDKSVRMPDPNAHITEIFNNLIREINVDVQYPVPAIKVPNELSRQCREMLGANKINGDDRVLAIHPGGHHPTQCWPLKRYIALAKRLAEEEGFKVLFFADVRGGKSITEVDASSFTENVLVITNISVHELIGFLSLSDLLICNNSGPLNIAVALGTPTVSIMGPTNRKVWSPVGECHTVISHGSLDCLGCNNVVCIRQDRACMTEIDTDHVFDVVQAKVNIE